MKQIVIVSGKGGTGKTSFTSNLAGVIASDPGIKNLVLVDADVDAANLNLVLTPEVLLEMPYSGGDIAVIDQDTCTQCGICKEACHFSAILHQDGQFSVDPFGCEGCSLCARMCPVEAISMQNQQNGKWYQSHTRFGECFHADLFPGQGNSGKLVTEIRQKAAVFARKNKADLLVIDGPPGIGCPVMAAVTGCHLAVIVTEPSASGLYDLQRVLGTLHHFKIPAVVVLNKDGLNEQASDNVAAFCLKENLPLIGKIPYTTAIITAMVEAKTITETMPGSTLVSVYEKIWINIKQSIGEI